MKRLITIMLWILMFMITIVLSIVTIMLIGALQELLFVNNEKAYIMWIFKSPATRSVLIYEGFIAFGVIYLFNKGFRKFLRSEDFISRDSLLKKHKKLIFSIFIVFHMILLYSIITSVTVISKNKIIDYSFFSPQGRVYHYNDIVKINTGVYGKNTRSKGEFFYFIKLYDGKKIDLAEVGGTKNDEDPRFIIEKLDRQFVNMGIPKQSSMDNFEYTKKNLAKVYTDKIQKILKNK